MKTKSTSKAILKVYSYIRFSSPEQSLGDSERRQLETAKKFAQQHNLQFDESLNMTDRGVSGFHGVHRKKGVLGKFLLCVEEGLVAPGSILVVENVDRLSREGAVNTLKEIIFKLWEHDITLQTLSPQESYAPGCDSEPKFLALLIYIQRAYDESLQKSKRVSAARKNARKLARTENKILTKRCPAWLQVINKEFQPIPEAVETINKIFDLKLQGFGKTYIAKNMNKEASWSRPKGWRESYIQKILRNRAVIGEYQPHQITNGKRKPVGEPIQNYYPVIIQPETFYAVQELFKQNKGTGGKTGKARNLFTNLAKCPYCGGSMAFINKGKPPKGANYLVCDNGRRGNGCSAHSIRYDEIEALILNNCRKLKPKEILPDPDEQAERCESLHKKIKGKSGELNNNEKRIKNLEEQIETTSNADRRNKYEGRIIQLEKESKEIKAEINKLEMELHKAETRLHSLARWKNDVGTLQEAIQKEAAVELRIKLRFQLKEFIDKIEFYTDGFTEIYDCDKDNGIRAGKTIKKDGKRTIVRKPQYFNNTEWISDYLYDIFGEFNPKAVGTKRFAEFADEMIRRRMSKEGRFVRVHYKTGSFMDLVPEGSLASGKDINGLFVDPKIGKLWDVFNAK